MGRRCSYRSAQALCMRHRTCKSFRPQRHATLPAENGLGAGVVQFFKGAVSTPAGITKLSLADVNSLGDHRTLLWGEVVVVEQVRERVIGTHVAVASGFREQERFKHDLPSPSFHLSLILDTATAAALHALAIRVDTLTTPRCDLHRQCWCGSACGGGRR